MKEVNGTLYLTYSEAGTSIGVDPASIPTMVKRGKLRAIKFNGDKHKYIKKTDVDQYGKEDSSTSNSANQFRTNTPSSHENRVSGIYQQMQLQGNKTNGAFSVPEILIVIHTIQEGYIEIANRNVEIAKQYTVAISPITERLSLALSQSNDIATSTIASNHPMMKELLPLLARSGGYNANDVNALIDETAKEAGFDEEATNILKKHIASVAKDLGAEVVTSNEKVAC